MKKGVLAVIVALVVTISGITQSAQATGIPVFDAQQETNMLQNLLKQLEQYAKQLEQYALQLEQYKQQILDSAKPYTDMWQQATNLYKKGYAFAQDIQNVYTQATSAYNYIKDNYGDADFWKRCAINACDPTGQLQLAYKAVQNSFENVIAGYGNVIDAADKTQEAISKTIDNMGSNPGVRADLEDLAKINAQMAQVSIQGQKLQAQYYKAEADKEKAKEVRARATVQHLQRLRDTL